MSPESSYQGQNQNAITEMINGTAMRVNTAMDSVAMPRPK
jgi:hypothetical protein